MSGRARAALAALALLALAGGCLGALRRAPPPKQRFVLQAAPPAAPSGPTLGALRLERVRVSPVFDHKSFVYRLGESRFETDYYHEFFSPPGVLLQEALRQWLAAAGPFAVAERGGGPQPRWELEAGLEELYADRRDPAAPRAVLALSVRLLDARSGALALDKRYRAEEPAADASPDALVAAWNRGLGELLGALGADLRAAATAAGSGGASGTGAGAEPAPAPRRGRNQR